MRFKPRVSVSGKKPRTVRHTTAAVKKTGRYQFDRDEFQRITHKHGPIHLDANGQRINPLIPKFCDEEHPFLSTTIETLKGQTVWIDANASPDVLKDLKHFESLRQSNPAEVTAIILVPDIPKRHLDRDNFEDYSQLVSMVKRYEKLHQYPSGTYLFSDTDTDTPVPAEYPYTLYLADLSTESRLASASLNSLQTEQAKQDGRFSRSHTKMPRNPKNIKPHQPRFMNPAFNLTSQREEKPLLEFNLPFRSGSSEGTGRFMIDSGASIEFVRESFIQQHKIKTYTLQHKYRIVLADQRIVLCSQAATIDFTIGDQTVSREFAIMATMPYDLILGMAFLTEINPEIDFNKRTMTPRGSKTAIQGDAHQRAPDIQILSANQMVRQLRRDYQKHQKYLANPTKLGYEAEDSYDESSTDNQYFWSTVQLVEKSDPNYEEVLCMAQSSDAYSTDLPRQSGRELRHDAEMEKYVQDQIDSITTDFGPQHTKDIQLIVDKHRVLLQPMTGLPPSRPGFDYEVPLQEGAPIPTGKVYRMSTEELAALRTQLDEYVQNGWLRPSTSPYSSPVLFSRKKNPDGTFSGLRLCTDYRQINKYTKRLSFPLPNCETILDTVGRSHIFSSFDLAHGFHQIRVKDNADPDNPHSEPSEHIQRTAICTHYGLYEWVVCPFGMSNIPSHFQRFLNHVLEPHKRPWLSIYLDDILLHTEDIESHKKKLDELLSLLEDNDLVLRFSKCNLAKKQIQYLGHILKGGGIAPADSKIKAVRDWPTPKNVKDCQQFLGFVNFYRRYIRNYSDTAAPIYQLCGKDVPFIWNSTCAAAFSKLKRALTCAPVLSTPRTGPNESFVVSTDASGYAIGCVLLQYTEDGKELKPCAYYAKMLAKNQQDYSAYDTELLGIACALAEWRVYLEGCKNIQVITDHATLKYLPTQQNLGRRHAPWINKISPYMNYMQILYRKGELNDADPLSRRPDLIGLAKLTEAHINSEPALAKAFRAYETSTFEQDLEDLREFLGSMTHLQADPDLLKEIRKSYLSDPAYSEYSAPVGVTHDPDTGLYWKADKLCVPNDATIRNKILREYHNVSGHPDFERTYANIIKSFYWPSMRKHVRQYVKKCDTCQKIKPSTQKPLGSLSPLPTPSRPWEMLSMDFISGLPEIDGYDSIVTFVDLFSKQAHFVPCTKTINAKQLAKIYIDTIYKHHGTQRTFIGDRDGRYTSAYFKNLMKEMQTKMNLSTSYHPQTDGQTERTHRTIEQILRGFVHETQDSWYNLLSLAEFSYNNLRHSSTGYTPFEALYGFSPYTPASLIQPPAVRNTSGTAPSVRSILDIHDIIREHIKLAKADQKHFADQRTQYAEFSVGDTVLLNTQNLKLKTQPNKKLRQRFIGPFPIISKISSQAYKLELPPEISIHPAACCISVS